TAGNVGGLRLADSRSRRALPVLDPYGAAHGVRDHRRAALLDGDAGVACPLDSHAALADENRALYVAVDSRHAALRLRHHRHPRTGGGEPLVAPRAGARRHPHADHGVVPDRLDAVAVAAPRGAAPAAARPDALFVPAVDRADRAGVVPDVRRPPALQV